MKKWLLTMLLALTLVVPAIAYVAKSDVEVLEWVEKVLETGVAYPLPAVYRMTAEEMQELYCSLIPDCESPEMLLLTVEAFYDSRTEEIFLTDFEDDCYEEAVLAHEFTHHLQNKISGWQETEFAKAYREKEAYDMQDQYYYEFCSTEGQ
ncbi:MAG: hypothetical protein ACXACY_30525 [Candidatus Hodarchaeales archaeon]|jgi:hypothetical protein